MKQRRSKEEWLAIIEEFEQSSLSNTDFCKQRGLCRKYFSGRRKAFQEKPKSLSKEFVQAIVAQPSPVAAIEISIGAVQLKVQTSVETDWLVGLVNGLTR